MNRTAQNQGYKFRFCALNARAQTIAVYYLLLRSEFISRHMRAGKFVWLRAKIGNKNKNAEAVQNYIYGKFNIIAFVSIHRTKTIRCGNRKKGMSATLGQ